jgi:hypothetical protein
MWYVVPCQLLKILTMAGTEARPTVKLDIAVGRLSLAAGGYFDTKSHMKKFRLE